MAEGNSVLGSIIITLEATPEGVLEVGTRIEGTLQYITALGMVEMAKPTLEELANED